MCRCAKEEEGWRTRGRERKRQKERERERERTKKEGCARSREFESRTDGINCALFSSSRGENSHEGPRTLARVTRESRSPRGDFYHPGFFDLQEGRSSPPLLPSLRPALGGFLSDQSHPRSLLQRAPSPSYPATLSPSSTAAPTLK